MQDGSFSLPTSIIPNDGIIEAVPAGNANEESIQQLGENSLEDDGILALLTTGKLVDKLKNGKVDEVSSLVKEVVAKGIDDEDIGKLLAEVITLLVDLSWDENKKSTSSKSGKSSKKSSDDPPITTTQAPPSGKSSKKSSDDPPVTTTQAPPATTTTTCLSTFPPESVALESQGGGDCDCDADCIVCKCIRMFCYSELLFVCQFFI